MQNKMTRARIAQLAATHALDLHCTQDGCAAVVVGPLPEEWLADPDTGDVLCPQCRAQAVWLRRAESRECPVHTGSIHGGEAEELRAGIEALTDRYHDGAVPRLELIQLLDRVDARDSFAFLERSDDEIDTLRWLRQLTAEFAATNTERSGKAAALLDRMIASLASSPLDGVDQGDAAPTAVLRETSASDRPGLIGDETLDLDPTGEGR